MGTLPWASRSLYTRTYHQWGGGLFLPTSAATGPLLSSPPAWQLLPWLGLAVSPCGGVLRGLPAAGGDSIVPGVASLLQEELGMAVAHSIPSLPGLGVDQPALLEAVVCAIWLTSSPGPPGPISWGCLRLLWAGSKLRAGKPSGHILQPGGSSTRHRGGLSHRQGAAGTGQAAAGCKPDPVGSSPGTVSGWTCLVVLPWRVAQGARNRAAGGD